MRGNGNRRWCAPARPTCGATLPRRAPGSNPATCLRRLARKSLAAGKSSNSHAQQSLPIIAIAASLIAIIAIQFTQNASLRTEIKELNQTIVEYRDGQRDAGGLSALSTSDGESSDKAASNTGGEIVSTAPFSIDADAGSVPLSEILAQRDPMLRMGALLAYVRSLNDDEIPAALTELRQSTPEWDPDARVAAQLMLTRWGKADPASALAYIDGLPVRKAGGDAAIIISAIAASDPQQAIEWLQKADNNLAKQPWMGQILAGSITKEWVRQDPEAALEWATTLPRQQQTGAYGGVLGTLAATDPARASKLAIELPEGDARRDVIGQIARSFSASPDDGGSAA